MNIKKIFKFFLVLSLSSNIFITTLSAYNSVEECDRQLYEISQKTDNTKKDMQIATDESEKLRLQIQEHNKDINNFNLQLSELEQNIISINKEIEEKKKVSDNKQEIVLKQLKLQQRATNNNTFLNLLVSAESIASFTTAYNVIQKIALEEKKELEEIAKIKKKLIDLNDEQILKTKQISSTKTELEKITNEKIRKKQELSNILIQQEEDLQKYAADEKDIARQREILLTPPPIENNNDNNINNPNNSTWTLPTDTGAIITARFMSPTYEEEFGRKHRGTDISLYKGAPIYTIANGRVLKACRWGALGNIVVVGHEVNGEKYTTLYAHLSAIYVNIGDYVKSGSKIGAMGGTGFGQNSYPVHLHIEIAKRDYFTTDITERDRSNFEVLTVIPWKGNYHEAPDAW